MASTRAKAAKSLRAGVSTPNATSELVVTCETSLAFFFGALSASVLGCLRGAKGFIQDVQSEANMAALEDKWGRHSQHLTSDSVD